MKDADSLELESRTIGALPIVNEFLRRLGIESLLDEYVPSRSNQKLSYAGTILALIRNVVISRNPLYKIAEWADAFDRSQIGLDNLSAATLNDDRIGRSLDALFDADRASLLTRVVLSTVAQFKIDLSQLHNDSTTVTVSGEYRKNRSRRRGKPSLALAHGHNKDHREDLKQLLFTLSVSRDGAVPIHYKGYDGNTTDDKTHIQTWEALRRLTGNSEFIYVADSKLCTREQMEYLSREGGRFITVMPETRRECAWFRAWRHDHGVYWSGLLKRPDPRAPGSREHKYWGYESPVPSQEGYRIIWILSSQKREQDASRRQRRIEKTVHDLDKLKGKYRSRRTSREQIAEQVQAVLQKHRCATLFDWKLTSETLSAWKQKSLGRPGKHTEYTRKTIEQCNFEAMVNVAQVRREVETDGMFPLMTNITELSMREILRKYKYQPYIEKRHQQLKSVLKAAPVFLKTPHRIDALMFVYFIALLINALIERQLRLSMERRAIPSLFLYPEHRRCRYPATQRVLELFSQHRRHVLSRGSRTIRFFHDKLSKIQEQVLDLLDIPVISYVGDE